MHHVGTATVVALPWWLWKEHAKVMKPPPHSRMLSAALLHRYGRQATASVVLSPRELRMVLMLTMSDSGGPRRPRCSRFCVTSMGPIVFTWNCSVIDSAVAVSTPARSIMPELFKTMSTCDTDCATCFDHACRGCTQRSGKL
jgi:hypothetical protein